MKIAVNGELRKDDTPASSTNDYFRTLRRTGSVVLLTLVAFALLELALQVRSHLRFGQSVFNAVSGQTMYVYDERGLKRLRPNSVFGGEKGSIITNSLGLRGRDLVDPRPKDSFRIALVGASTVMGGYAKNNDYTLAEFLRAQLAASVPSNILIEVVNAGIAGAVLRDQAMMLDFLSEKVNPDLVVLYTGFNDFGRYCEKRASTGDRKRVSRADVITLPGFLLTVDLLRKNTVFLRTKPPTETEYTDVDSLDYSRYIRELDALLERAAERRLDLVVATNARAYRRDQPLDEQLALSATARYYNHCFDLNGLHEVVDRHNQLLREKAFARRLPVLDLAAIIPGGSRYFSDSTHFNEAGERFVAEALARFLLGNNIFPSRMNEGDE